MDPTPRRAARILLVDGSDRLLMFHGFDPARPAHHYWFTAGGGLAATEPAAAGAARELAEETGLRLTAEQLGEPVWREVTEYPFDGRWYRQEQEFFLVRVSAWEVRTDGFNQVERDSIDGHRWWTIEELETTTEHFYPEDLPALLRRLLSGDAAGTGVVEFDAAGSGAAGSGAAGAGVAGAGAAGSGAVEEMPC